MVENPDCGAQQRSHFGLGWNSSTPTDTTSLNLLAAEEAAQQVFNCVHPTLDSEEKRRDVIDYIHQLIKSHLNVEVFPYGSVPLKTYLPDGDIDLTALKCLNAEESLAHDVFSLLQRQEKEENAEFQVKDTQFIDAEVKLVKCLVQNIVIDISFNQLGGLSTLCFLEQVDRLVGRNHLFKRSIILVKAWCYYESRILGANHGLISTYALETLILYIFHLFHTSLSGPLTVLYRFLEYYSQFDWENYCISLKGPVCKSSLPDIVVKMPENGWKDLMLSEEFLENCMEMFSVSSRVLEGKPKAFQAKHLNIIDPLKENNNLGRSVHIGNLYRIRSAFKYGAHKLGQVLLQPRDKVAHKISEFFANTARYGNDCRSSIERSILEFGLEFKNVIDRRLIRELPSIECSADSSYAVSITASGSSNTKANSVDHLSLDCKETEASNPLSDLGGDYDSHIRSLLYGQLCHGFSLSASVVNHPPYSPSRVQNKKPRDTEGTRNSRVSSYSVSMEQNMCVAANLALSAAAFSSQGTQKARGTGTYFPHTGNYRGRASQGRSRNRTTPNRNQSHRYRRNNDLNNPSDLPNNIESGSDEVLPARSRSQGQRRLDLRCQSPSSVGDKSHVSGGSPRIEFGSIGNLAEEVISASSHVMGATLGTSPTVEGTTAVMKQERKVARSAVHLKSEDEFPPLSPMTAQKKG